VADSATTVLVSNSGIAMVPEEDQDLEASACTFGMPLSTAPPTVTMTVKPSASAMNTVELLAACLTPCPEAETDRAAATILFVSVSIPALTSRSMQYHNLGISRSEPTFILPSLDCSNTKKAKLSPWDTGEQAKETHNHIIRDSLLMVSWLPRPPDRAKLSDKLLLFTKEAQVDERSLQYLIHCGFETIQWEIAWTWRYEFEFLIQTDGLQVDRPKICILALVEHLYKFSKLSRPCEPLTSWQIFFISGTGIASTIYTLLICLKDQDESEMRPELSTQTKVFYDLGTCSSLHNIEFPWFVGSSIQTRISLFLGNDNFRFQLSTGGLERDRKSKTTYGCGSWSYLVPYKLALRSVLWVLDIVESPLGYYNF
jgi:hypothetical protein